MAKGTNKALLLGHVGKDPEIRSSSGGTTVASFSLATADRQKDVSGNWVDKTEWHNIVAFSGRAEVIRDYVKKGNQLFIVGKIQTRSWDDKESGQTRYRTEILVDELILLGGGSSKENSRARSGNGRGALAQDRPNLASNGDYADREITDDDIPF